MAHRTKILRPASQVRVPICSCGWIGSDHGSDAVARSEADLHELTTLRGGASAPAPRTAGGKGTP